MTNLSNEVPEQLVSQSLMGHLNELRKRLLWCFVAMLLGTVICYIYVEDIYGILVQPLADAMGPNDTNRMIYTDPTEVFFTYLKVALFAGTFLTFPVLLLQLWRFIAPGLYKNERNAFLPFLVATPILFFLGGLLVQQLILPFALKFFLSFQSSGADTVLPIQLEARVADYLGLVMVLIFAFGLCFQLPVLLALLARVGILTADHLVKARRYAIVIIFIVAAILTPPDVFSQISLAIPLMILYEISILIVRKITTHKADDTL